MPDGESGRLPSRRAAEQGRPPARTNLWPADPPNASIPALSPSVPEVRHARASPGSARLLWDYRAAALEMDWGTVDASPQTLILALMGVAGAGWLTLAAAMAALLVFAFPGDRLWVRVILALLVLIFYGPTLWTTVAVTVATPAEAPWYGNAMALAAMLVAVLCDLWPAGQQDASR